ncbi:protein PHOX1-like [Olea europaea var. sylvestris]|uniref:Myosin assembly sexual cycle n=1 Tax=Olea europaea subsp. europaea TaxID=158383 RepID=A0A8S0Q1I5_OLEEU|nr:protein PHOX1-like [Olea europaea var. sylvestris]XP_022870207.1 protein PHOX1-like [Olea europaea var. sylvestris]XP_022870208.1 protein PHOX1-like [Olea europaea var. sylvestris]XP_022870210.1 protein PHOX1-like [Olea europaea var. sylvestris]XP_022870211.1 protein PHOX1-like [Olea europaea var. sylvestris]CAA2960128.1 Myosin assembly sexual cycle [Olea europaea subsp. europaea]
MGKNSGKNKMEWGSKSFDLRQSRGNENNPRAMDKDTAVFILLSKELKDEGNRLFQSRDYEGAMLKYEKAINLLPRNHINVSHLRSNMAACYMQLGISEFPRAIHECNLALEVTPKYSKALLKRARCYEALNRLDLALRDVGMVLKMEPNNFMAAEIEGRVKTAIDKRGTTDNDIPLDPVPLPEYFEPPSVSTPTKAIEEKMKKKKSNVGKKKIEEKTEEKEAENLSNEKKQKEKTEERKTEDEVALKNSQDRFEEKKAEDKVVVEVEKISNTLEVEPKRTVKLVFGEDIRWAQIPVNCSILKLREIISDRFPSSKAVLVKYRDQEGDLVTITTTEELRWAEASVESGSVKLYIVEVNPDQDPFFEKVKTGQVVRKLDIKQDSITENGNVRKMKQIEKGSVCINDWIIQFAQLFKNYVGFDTDAYIDLHELGVKLYSEAMEETVTSDEAQDLFATAAEKFQEMAALALFNWGNVHMSRARKRVYFVEDSSRESILAQIKSAYDWAQKEYTEAGKIYDEALKIKPDFYDAILALAQKQFEQAKLSWYYAIATNVDLESWPATEEVLQLYNNAEENIEKGMEMWEEAEEQRQYTLSHPNKISALLQKMNMGNMFKDISAEEAEEQAENITSQIYVLWGTMLYERSIMEYKIGIPVWHECLEVAIEKFEQAGASSTDIAVMIKNHCSNDTALEGLGFNISEIVQAWNEMYEAKKWQNSVPAFRLEPLLRRRASKIYHALEHA